jgi:thymidylate synthase
MKFKMSEGFPLLTLRKIHTKSLIHEILWFLGSFDSKWDRFGNTNIRYLLDNGVTFWSEWPYEHYNKQRKYRPELPELTIKDFEEKIRVDDKFAIDFGGIGPGYGKQWVNYGGGVERFKDEQGNAFMKVIQGVNQIEEAIDTLKKNPDSRRIIVDAWNPADVPQMLLPCCHMMFQFNTYKMDSKERLEEYKKWVVDNKIPFKENMDYYKFPDRKLSLQMYQRSVDSMLGWPFNVAEYSLLLHMVAQIVNMIPDEFVWVGGDTHVYNNHIEQAKEVISRDSYPLPTLKLNKNITSIYDFRYDDIIIDNYKSHPNIKMDVDV